VLGETTRLKHERKKDLAQFFGLLSLLLLLEKVQRPIDIAILVTLGLMDCRISVQNY
jgi:hypothetical protein